MRCFRCLRFGHGRDRCRENIDLCVKCGEPGHRGEECDRSHKCVNCKGDNPASSKNCPKYLEEQAILRYRIPQRWHLWTGPRSSGSGSGKGGATEIVPTGCAGMTCPEGNDPRTSTKKTESLPMAHSSATKKARPTNDQPRTNETRTFENKNPKHLRDMERIQK
ncbi:nucleic-acid-binding protein from mobile element jockey [Elysia marginata]|uniref:Nucleic-acid-binding protein from mobile element jockey n=1 Tax=Elysia marginata TaxID=1093978 RepID=A0AAV4JL55_9GAST|nr:nucleic-acid-binding protein from mobile element jockey [Elysia marginata]